MELAINKKNAVAAMADEAGTPEVRTTAGILVALIEIREAIEEGFAKLDQTHIEGALTIFAYKETFDEYVKTRLKADKVLSGIVATMLAKPPEKDEKPDRAPSEENKSGVTLDHGDFGKAPSGSGQA